MDCRFMAHLGRVDPPWKCPLTGGKRTPFGAKADEGAKRYAVRAGQRRRISPIPGRFGSDNGMLSEVILPPARQELAAGWVHRRELSAAEQKNSSRESPMPTDPGANRRRIGFRDNPRCLGSRILPSMSINSDRSVKTQYGLTRDANPI